MKERKKEREIQALNIYIFIYQGSLQTWTMEPNKALSSSTLGNCLSSHQRQQIHLYHALHFQLPSSISTNKSIEITQKT